MIDIGYIPVSATFDVQWDTQLLSTGASVTPSTPGTIRIYKDNSTTERTSSAGITDSRTWDGVVGTNNLRIDLSNNAHAGFYAEGSTYHVKVIGIVIGGATINATLFRFTIGARPANVTQWNGTNIPGVDAAGYPKVTIKAGTGAGELNLNAGVVDADAVKISRDETAANNLESQFDGVGLTGDAYPARQDQAKQIESHAISGLPRQVAPGSVTLDWGIELSGTVASTVSENGSYHRIGIDGVVFDIYYEFDVGDAVAGAVRLRGRLGSTSATMHVDAWNWAGSAWERLGQLQESAVDKTYLWSLRERYTGTGADAGKVRIRFEATSGGSFDALYVDQILVGAAPTAGAAAIADAVWDEATSGHATAGTFGKLQADAYAILSHATYGLSAIQTLLTSTGIKVLSFANSAITAAAIDAGAFVEAKFGSDFWTKLIASVWTDAGSRSLTDKAGFQLAADQAVNVTKVGGTSVSGPNDLKADVSALLTSSAFTSALPANFGSLAIDGSGQVTVGSILAAVIEAIAVEVDARLLDAGDATDLIASIVTRIGNTNVDEAALVAAIKAALFDAGSAANKLSVDSSGRVTVGSNADKTGYLLAADQAVNVTKVGGTSVSGPNDLKATGFATPADVTNARDAVIDALPSEPDNAGIAAAATAAGQAKTAAESAQAAAEALPSATDIDAQLSGTHGDGSWEDAGSSIGAGSEIVAITVQNAANAAQKIEGIPVSAYASGVLADRRTSGALGTLSMHLNPGTHRLSAANPGLWQMADPEQQIDVVEGGPNEFIVELIYMPITPPAVGRAVGWILLLDEKSQPIADAEVSVLAYKAPKEGTNSAGVSPPKKVWTVVSAANGMVEFGPTVDDPDAGLLGGWTYRIWGESIDGVDVQTFFTVPEEAIDDPEGFSIRSFIRKVASS